MGHIVRTPAGTYRANWRDATGRQKAKNFRTKKQASTFLAETEASIARGTYVDPHAGRKRFGVFETTWRASRHVETRTSERTESVMRVHVLPEWEDWPLANIHHTAVQDWVNRLSERLAPASVSKCFGALSMVLDAAIQARLIPANPCDGVKLPSTTRPRRTSLAIAREDFFGRLLPAVDEVDPRYRALVATPAGTGLRWGECLGLSWGAVDFDRRTVRVVQVVEESGGVRTIRPYPKSRAGLRTVPVPGFLLAELRRLYEENDRPGAAELLFTGRTGRPPLRATFRRQVWRPALVRAGLLGQVVPLTGGRFEARWADAAGTQQTSRHATEAEAAAEVAARAVGGLRFHDLVTVMRHGSYRPACR